jgi:hypothetical protein
MELLTQIAQGNLSGNPGGSPAGNVIISPFGELIVSLIQLAMQDAELFKQTAAEAAARAQQEAAQASSADMKQFLNRLSEALQQASQSGELSQIAAPSTLPTLSYSRSGQPLTANAVSGIGSSTLSTSLAPVLSSLTSQVQAALRGKAT